MHITKKLRNNRLGDYNNVDTTVDITLSETHLTLEFFCKNSKFYCAGDNYNDPIYDGDVCEAFVCTDGSRKNYYEIEVAPNNCVFLMKMTNYGGGKITAVPISENFVESEVEIIGNDYRLKFSLPLDKIGYDKKTGILLNAYRIETEGGITDKNLLALNPTFDNTFHRPEFFVEIKED